MNLQKELAELKAAAPTTPQEVQAPEETKATEEAPAAQEAQAPQEAQVSFGKLI
jgi:hypothetical protein